MPYQIDDFKRLGIYEEKTGNIECSFEGGKVINVLEVTEKVKELLRTSGGSSNNGDASRQDSSVITSLLNSGLSPADVYSTFADSVRGRDAERRKEGHFEDYMQRTIERAVAFLRSKNGSNGKVTVNFSNARAKPSGSGLIISMGHEVETERTQWVWPGYIPAGKLTLLAGDPGMGKSTMVGDLIARISKGAFLPTGQRSITGTSLIASAEDSPEDTIIPRLIACDANLKRVGVIREVRDENTDEGSRYLSFPRDLDLLRQTLIAKGCRLLIIDPLNAFLDKGTDSYKDQDIRRVLHPLEMMAEETGTAILIVAHLNKKEDSGTLYRVGGSIGFIGAARSVLAVTKLPDDTSVLYSLKSNLSARPASMAYEIKQVRKNRTDRNTWLGESSISSSGVRWLGEVDFNPFQKNQVVVADSRVKEQATDFLRQVLASGQMDTDSLYVEAKTAGVNRSHLHKVRAEMGIIQNRVNGKWFWNLPEA